MSAFIVTGLKGFEPLMTESESVALPLGDSPSTTKRSIAQLNKIFKYFFKLFYFLLFEKVNSILVWILLFPYTTSLTMDFTDSMIKIYIGLDSSG